MHTLMHATCSTSALAPPPRAEAQKNLLRTHTTAVSSRMLYRLAQEGFKPAKYFRWVGGGGLGGGGWVVGGRGGWVAVGG
jgi:hypothetical protein